MEIEGHCNDDNRTITNGICVVMNVMKDNVGKNDLDKIALIRCNRLSRSKKGELFKLLAQFSGST